jgi:hypothetical protein
MRFLSTCDIDGAALLRDTRAFLTRFCVFPDEHCAVAVTLWTAHTHMIEHFHTSPRLALLSPEPSSGKTRVLEVLDLLVPESVFCLNARPATIFRTLALRQITLLADECDAIFRYRSTDEQNEDLRALLNAGYKRGAVIPRCVGPKHEVQNFKVYCATALAGLGDLPDTIMSRSVIIRMRRRAPAEPVEPFRSRQHETAGHELRDRLSHWAHAVGADVGASWPQLPAGVVDRPAEVWEPLLAIGDAAGGEWPTIARKACEELCKVSQERRTSLGVRLLSDLRIIFQRAGDPEALHTETIVEHLTNGDEHGLDADAPWADLHGKPLGKRGLASMLVRYNVRPIKVTVRGKSLQGYRREHLWDAWVRYLPTVSPTPAQPELPEFPASIGAKPVPGIPGIPGIQQREGAQVICSDCRHFKAGTNGNGLGTCLKYGTDAAPSVPFCCPGFRECPR